VRKVEPLLVDPASCLRPSVDQCIGALKYHYLLVATLRIRYEANTTISHMDLCVTPGCYREIGGMIFETCRAVLREIDFESEVGIDLGMQV
jgi:hypothetical protein